MTGYVQKHGSGWRYKIELDEVTTGGKKSISKSGFEKSEDAKRALRQKLVDIDNGTYIEDKKTLLSNYLNEWLETHKCNLAPSSYRRYKDLLNTVKTNIGKTELLKLTPITIQKFYSKLITEGKLSNSTIQKIHRVLSAALKQAVGWQMINSNPCSFVKPPRIIKPEMHCWTENELKHFLFVSRVESLYLHFAIAACTGMRLGEICALRWDCVDTKRKEIMVRRSIKRCGKELLVKQPKTKSSIRKIPITTELNDLLIFAKKKQEKLKKENEKYIDQDYVCAWEDDGRPYDPDYISKHFHNILEKYEMPRIRFHDLRHTHATILLLHDTPAKVVSERLGHSTVSMTLDIYSHVLPDMQQTAVEKLNGLLNGVL